MAGEEKFPEGFQERILEAFPLDIGIKDAIRQGNLNYIRKALGGYTQDSGPNGQTAKDLLSMLEAVEV